MYVLPAALPFAASPRLRHPPLFPPPARVVVRSEAGKRLTTIYYSSALLACLLAGLPCYPPPTTAVAAATTTTTTTTTTSSTTTTTTTTTTNTTITSRRLPKSQADQDSYISSLCFPFPGTASIRKSPSSTRHLRDVVSTNVRPLLRLLHLRLHLRLHQHLLLLVLHLLRRFQLISTAVCFLHSPSPAGPLPRVSPPPPNPPICRRGSSY
ncbi:hypothetical protein DCS_07561 [Drechmeria coniospora]|uniref:Uncharacterized protein n=1 Tax=Drechmeria coniospora TaxID=98403 RepID=A0A151GET4_DRECN|nr:hypothetical protein DCS_07561 [Drechmeria coniospora]KYK55598.1 hypothetical protein DCS_07561 [Drechmeria coniospora]